MGSDSGFMIGFAILVVTILALDLGVFNRNSHRVTVREATMNIFAILGLRSLYFLLAGVIDKFHYLQIGLSIVLGFVGIKMLAESISDYTMVHPIHFPIQWSLVFIGLVLAGAVAASLLFPKQADDGHLAGS